jgi:hypothetical protein
MTAGAKRRSRFAVIHDDIAANAKAQDPERTAFERWQDVIGIAEGLPAELSQRTGERFGELLSGSACAEFRVAPKRQHAAKRAGRGPDAKQARGGSRSVRSRACARS